MSVTARLRTWIDRTSDTVSPLVVKEARQLVRGREFAVSFTVSLLVGLVVSFGGATMVLAGNTAGGRWTFAALTVCMAFLGLGVVPLSAFSRLRHEQAEQTLELITLTALTSRRIVIGKLLAQSVKLLTLFAALAPFMAMSFLLGGIGLTTILMGLLLIYMGSIWMGALCLFLSTLVKTRAVSGLVFGGAAVLLLILLVLGFWLFQSMVRGQMLPSLLGLGTTSLAQFKEFAILATFWLTTLINFVLLAENRLSLATEDTVTPLRLGFFLQFAMMLFWGTTLWFTTYRLGTADLLGRLAGVHLAVVAAFVLTEGLAAPRRVLQRMRTDRRGNRLLALFGPGAGRGAAYVLAQMLLLVAVWATFEPPALEWRRVLAMCGYICFFTGVPVLVLRNFWPALATTFRLRVAVLCGIAAVMVVPDILHYIIVRPETLDLAFSGRHLLNPFRTIAVWDQVEAYGWMFIPGLIGVTGLLSYAGMMWLGAQATSRAALSEVPAESINGETGRGGLIY